MTHALATWWSAIAPNLEASLLWGVPGFVTHHLLTRRHVTREADRQTRAITAHIDEATRERTENPR